MEHKGSDDAAVDPLAIPALYPHQESDAVPAIVLDVDGEVFELRPGESGGTSIRNFLAQVDPRTGYIEDDSSERASPP